MYQISVSNISKLTGGKKIHFAYFHSLAFIFWNITLEIYKTELKFLSCYKLFFQKFVDLSKKKNLIGDLYQFSDFTKGYFFSFIIEGGR